MSAKSTSGNERYRARRRLRLRRLSIFFGVLALLVIALLLWLSWRPGLRVQTITIYGADQSLAALVTPELAGTYAYLIPRNSILFVPESAIRRAVLSQHLEIATLSVFREGLDGLAIKINNRVPIARWCGADPADDSATGCYVFDSGGYVYAPYADATSTTQAEPVNGFSLYDPLAGDATNPLGATLAQADSLPAAFDFARQISAVGTSM